MDAKVLNILKDKVASEWKIFAFCTGLNDVAAVVDQIDHDVDIDQKGHDDLTREKSKIEFFLQKLYQQHPNDYRTCIQNSLKFMRRNDILQDVDFSEMDTNLVSILKDKVASDWKIFAICTGLNDVAVVVEQIDHEVDIDQKGHDDLTREKCKIECFLKKLYQQRPNDYRTCIQNSLKVIKRNDVLHDIDFLGLNIPSAMKPAVFRKKDFSQDSPQSKSFERGKPLKPSIEEKESLNIPSAMKPAVFRNKDFSQDSPQGKSFERGKPLKPSIEEKEKMREALKKYYLKTYGKMDEVVHLLKTSAKLVNADEVGKDTVSIAERELFLQRQLTYQPVELKEAFSKELSLLLISGIAGIGKTCLLRKCLLDWASGILWKTVDFVIYFECKKLNQFQNIGNINELIKVFYKDIFQECNVCEDFTILFVIDGLDEFAHLDKLIKYNLLNSNKKPIVYALAEALTIQKYKRVVAGRVEAISQYKEKVKEYADKLTIQIMGFNENEINKYVENISKKKETIKSVLKESLYAKAMASVPFYLSAMCSIITSSESYSFNTMTELYCSIFLYFFQTYICKTNDAVHKMIQIESNKQHVLRVCKVAWELFKQGKILFFQDEMKVIVNDFDGVENELLGFIERVESQLGYQYQFAHLALMEFCASVHALICLSTKEILRNQKLLSCLPMICGLANENKKCLVRILFDLRNPNEERNSLLNALLDLIPKRDSFKLGGKNYPQKNYEDIHNKYMMFIECFFEAQASITEDMKRLIDEREWNIFIRDEKTAHEVLHEKYFMEKFFDAGCKLNQLYVSTNILSEDEKKLVILCSTNVCLVSLDHPVKIDEWTPSYKIEMLRINFKDTYRIKNTSVSKNVFEDFVLPWIRLAEELDLVLHDNTNFFDNICKWIRVLHFKKLKIMYRGKSFDYI